jgi:uncharacterized lipoprotein YddW (UPF0748 family)
LSQKLQPHERLKKSLLERDSWTNIGLQIQTVVVGTIIGTLVNSLVLLSAARAETTLGVVKSPDNERQWFGITARLQSTGLDYCVVDFAQVQQASDLGSTKLLFLPNIERLEPGQLGALQDWMQQGGRVIVSGPAGTLSQPEIRNKLRSLLGAYWGFVLPKPSTLTASRLDAQPWVPKAGLTSPIQGGVVIPAGLNANAAAVWRDNNNPPAVVTTTQSTFFGWRWGVDEVVPAAVDIAWLQAALSRYGTTTTRPSGRANRTQQYCVPSQAIAAKPTTPPPNRQQSLPPRATPSTPSSTSQGEPDVGVVPAQRLPNTNDRGSLTPPQVATMSRELENLIGRFESALLAANAANSNVNSQTGAAIEQFLVASTNSPPRPDNAQTLGVSAASRALVDARMGLQNFRESVARSDYNRARQQWFQARRTLWENYPIDRKLAQPEIRAIWLDRGTIVTAKSEQDLAKIFDRLAAAGFNTVFFETVNASYPIYPSRVAPAQNPLVRGWDPLAAAVKLAHERGMELHAWVWMFAAGNRRHNALLNQSADYPGPVLAAHPDWAMFDRQGRLFDPTSKKAFLDPANPEVRGYLMSLLDEIATRYQVDGIQLDYIRYPFQDPKVNQTYGYGRAARQQFQAQTGYDPIKISPSDRNLWQRWTDFRIQQIDSFVATVSQRLRRQRPSLILSTAVFPLQRTERLQRLQQNWEDWAIRGDVDLMVPMTYALDTMGLQNLAQPVLNQSTLSSTLVLPAIRLLNLPDIVAVDQMQLLRDLPTGGYSLFAVENLNANLRNIFSRTQGGSPSSASEPVPYRQPFPAAAARYAALQREWSFLLTNNQILIREPALSQWGKQADTLSQLLNQLAKEPSTQNLSSAKASLLLFRSQFQKWMQSQAVAQPYQVQVWDNRLATIEQLLRYGERTVLNPSRPSATQ